MSGLVAHYRAMARNNAWSNHRLLEACAALTPEAFAAKRVSFFPSLQATLNHILIIDWYYLAGLEGETPTYALFDDEIPHPRITDLRPAQREADRRLIAVCDGLTDAELGREVRLDRGAHGIHRETMGSVLPHLFIHQIHHRGQAHAMLAGTAVPPPQLDEFFLAADAPARDAELRQFGIPA